MNLNLHTSLKATAIGAIIFATGCSHYDNPYGSKDVASEEVVLTFDEPKLIEDNVLTSPVSIGVKKIGKGEFTFRFAGAFVDRDGNIDLSKGAPKGKEIELQFSLRSAPEGFTFVKDASEAFIVETESEFKEGGKKGPISGPRTFDRETREERAVFSDAFESSDLKTLSLRDHNNDGVTYQYGLNFSFKGKTVTFDPKVGNGEDD